MGKLICEIWEAKMEMQSISFDDEVGRKRQHYYNKNFTKYINLKIKQSGIDM